MSNVHAGRTADECLAFWRCKAEVIEKKLTEEQASAIQWGSLSNDDVERREVRWDAENGFPEKVTIRDGYAVFDGTSAMQEEVREGTGGVGNPEEQVLNLSKEILVRSAVSFPSIHEAIERAMRTHNTAFLAAHGPTIDHRKQLTYCANGFTTARELFKVAQYFDQQALSVFVLDGYASDHIQTVQELARLHEALEFWESDPKRLIGLLKRRVKLLEPVLEEINPTVYVQFYRQLSYEIGDIYKQLSDGIIGSQGEEYEVGVPHPVSGPEEARQLRRYISKAVKSFTRFLDSFKAPTQNGPLGVQDELDDSAIPHIITAREHIARLLSKEPSTSPMERLESLTTALSHYEWVRDYAWHHKEQISRSPKENQEAVRLTSEMAELVPVQIARLKSALSR
ncbi:hypothetical protein FOL47_004104 [Perkinsus chesapeaki]|uniref:KIF-binding protein n=1 Tax=Perkinsus chesapeaki TaxID=330153 RepID=A0A7J6M4T0_PERCH|nr:hypothetical protein FOL47_004104 [Perkinsus chesapeaki]